MPTVSIQFSNFDISVRKLSVNGQSNIITLGEGAYIVGANVAFGDATVDHILVGKYSSLAHDLHFIVGLNHDYKRVSTYPFENTGNWTVDCPQGGGNCRQVIVGHDVWIGAQTTIMGGVHIGNGAVIGANATVASDVPPYAIAVGNPARVIKYRFSPDVIDKLKKMKWWDWPNEKIQEALPLMTDVEKFLDVYYEESISIEDTQFVKDVAKLSEKHKLYHLCPDIYDEQLWKVFVRRYIEKYSKPDRNILLLWLEGNTNVDNCMNELKTLLVHKGENAPSIMSYQGDKSVMQSIANYIDVIVTTKEISSLSVIDSVNADEKNIMYVYDDM